MSNPPPVAVSLTKFTRMKSPARSMSALASKYFGATMSAAASRLRKCQSVAPLA